MKTNTLIIAALALTLGFSTCQNNAPKTESDHSTRIVQIWEWVQCR
jgi:hypothetical protein